MKIGVIGTGNMGSVLVSAFLESMAVQPSNMMVLNRTRHKAEKLAGKYKGLLVADDNHEVVEYADIVFVCVKPLEYYPLLDEINISLNSQKLLVFITSPISVEQMESFTNCSVARVIPSITNRALSGASLITYGSRCTPNQKATLERLMGNISNPIHIDQNVTRISSDIASCGPAFFGYLLESYIEAAVEETEISKEQATDLATEMIIGMGKLLEKEIYTLPTLIEKVCVKGGVTGEGINVFSNELGDLFNKVIKRTHYKYEEDCDKVEQQLSQNKIN